MIREKTYVHLFYFHQYGIATVFKKERIKKEAEAKWKWKDVKCEIQTLNHALNYISYGISYCRCTEMHM